MSLRNKLVVGFCASAIIGSSGAIAAACFPDRARDLEELVVRSRKTTQSMRSADGLFYDVYVPADLDLSVEHPLVYGTSPSGNAIELVTIWKPACDRLHWILLASSNFRNGPRSERDAAFELEAIARVRSRYKIDAAHIYATGLSGAAMHAHDLIGDHPEIFRGIVVNTGMMPHHFPGNEAFDAAHYPRKKLAVFLASPTDFRYPQMVRIESSSRDWIGK